MRVYMCRQWMLIGQDVQVLTCKARDNDGAVWNVLDV